MESVSVWKRRTAGAWRHRKRSEAPVTFVRRIAVGTALAVIAPPAFFLLVFLNQRASGRHARERIERAQKAVSQTHYLERLVVDMETGIRGARLTGRESFIEPYTLAVSRYSASLDSLKRLLADEPEQTRLLGEVEAGVEKWRQGWAQPRLEFQRNFPPAVGPERTLLHSLPLEIGSEAGKNQMDSIRGKFDALLARESDSIEQELELRDRAETRARVAYGAVAVATCVCFIFGGLALQRLYRRRILVLLEGMDAVQTGEYESIDLAGDDEPARVAGAFNRVVAEVARRDEELRQAVEKEETSNRELLAQQKTLLESRQLIIRAESQARKSAGVAQAAREELDRFFTLSLDLFVIAGYDGYFKKVNPAWEELLGFTVEELLSRPFLEFIHPDDRGITSAEYDRQRPGGRTDSFENRYLCKNGSYRRLSWNAVSLPEERLIYAAARDVTRRHELEAQDRRNNLLLREQARRLEEASRLKSEFLANMSHELRTPLNAIIGFAELIHDAKAGAVTSDQKEYLGDILASAEHLLQLINDILDLSKVESGKMEFRPEPVDLPRIVSEVRDILRALAAQKRISIEVSVDRELTGIVVDPGRLKQVLYNYLSNALKFSPDEGRVSVRLTAADETRFRLEVEDEGIGIAPEDLGRLFREFQQLDSGAAKKHAGTGLGLALTKRIVESQGGSVGVESVPGQGSLFFAELPRVAAIPAHEAPVSPAIVRRRGFPLILIIEDERKERDWLGRTLREAGYDTDFAATGREALERCRGQRYDAITLDLLLPDLSGEALLNAIRGADLNRETPVVVVSVAADSGGAAGFLVHDILQKPVRAEDLLDSLSRAGVSPRDPGAVLVVDDDPASLKLAKSALVPSGFRVQCHDNAVEALRAASDDLPAVIVLDLLMPDMDGFEFLSRFRETSAGRAVPVVVWTGKDLTTEDRAKLRGFAQAVIPKIGGASNLIAEIQSRISARRSNDPAEASDGG